MKKIILSLLCIVALLQSCKKYDAFGNEILFHELYKAHWLLGEWEQKDSVGVLKEIWKIKDDSTYTGASYFIIKKDTIHRETIELIQDKDFLIYTTSIKGQNDDNIMAYKLTKDSDSLLVFENPTLEHPQKIQYNLKNDKAISVAITGVQLKKKSTEVYNLTKIK